MYSGRTGTHIATIVNPKASSDIKEVSWDSAIGTSLEMYAYRSNCEACAAIWTFTFVSGKGIPRERKRM
jgi:hypothetical protein